MFLRVKKAIKDINKEIKMRNLSFIKTYIKLVFFRIKYKASYKIYFVLELYNIKYKEIGEYHFDSRMNVLSKKYNNLNELKYVNDKWEFSLKYKKYLKREVISIDNSSEYEINQFLKR